MVKRGDVKVQLSVRCILVFEHQSGVYTYISNYEHMWAEQFDLKAVRQSTEK